MSKATRGGESIRQGTAGHQARFILAVACAVSVMCATSARAGNDPKVTRTVTDEQDHPFSDFDPCINSVVAGQGHFHSVFVDRSTATMVDTTTKFQHNGEATNTVAGDPADYRFASSGDQDFKSSTTKFSFTIEAREHIIREHGHYPGLPKDDYFTRTNITFSSTSTKPSLNRNSSESTCK